MAPPSDDFVLFKTELFLAQQDAKDIDKWFVGGDCAGWFYIRLLCVNGIKDQLEPFMEDWGWAFSLSVNEVCINVNVWRYFPIDACWIFGLEAQNRFFRRFSYERMSNAKRTVADGIEAILRADDRFEKHAWFAKNPFDLMIKEF